MNIFVFSSPLQYMFTLILANRLGVDNCRAYYYEFSKDFQDVFYKMQDYFSKSIMWDRIEDIQITNKDSLYLTNRFNNVEIELFQRYHNKVQQVNLYEEGFNFYLPHFFLNKGMNDTSFSLKIKNWIKSNIGLLPSHIYKHEFNLIYSVFPVPDLQSDRNILIDKDFKKLQILNSSTNDCVILSQWLVEHDYLTSDQYLLFIEHILNKAVDRFRNIYYKPHPRDSKNLTKLILSTFPKLKSLGSKISEIPVELIVAKNGICIIGFWSSAMFYSKKVLDVDTFTLVYELRKLFPDNERVIEFCDDSLPYLIDFDIQGL